MEGVYTSAQGLGATGPAKRARAIAETLIDVATASRNPRFETSDRSFCEAENTGGIARALSRRTVRFSRFRRVAKD